MPTDTQSPATFSTLDEFTRAYLVAALWLWDENAPSGQYEVSGRIEELSPRFSQEAIDQAVKDCADFRAKAGKDIVYMDVDQAGHDFWLTRNHHGSGFWDRDGLPDDLAKRTADLAQTFPEIELYEGDDGEFYFV